jgi:hypothetical protein
VITSIKQDQLRTPVSKVTVTAIFKIYVHMHIYTCWQNEPSTYILGNSLLLEKTDN